MIRNFRDIDAGSIIISKKGKQYIVLTDGENNKGLFDKNGVWSRVNYDTLTFGNNDSGAVKEVKPFRTLPALDPIIEACQSQ